MARHRRPARRGSTALRLLLAAVACTAAVVAVGAPSSAPMPARARAADVGVPVVVGSAAGNTVADPLRLRVPTIGVDSSLARLAVDATGALVPPADFGQAGWFAAGPAPGELGPAVLAGHVDSRRGPAVFFRLDQVRPGDEVLVDRADGTTVRFTVTRVASYPKTAFPTAEVYGPAPDPQLRLITCGGAFDRSRRSYLLNVVVYARAT
jgi:hypothetical protein